VGGGYLTVDGPEEDGGEEDGQHAHDHPNLLHLGCCVACHPPCTQPLALPTQKTNPERKERKEEATPFGVNFNEKPSIIPGCPGIYRPTLLVNTARQGNQHSTAQQSTHSTAQHSTAHDSTAQCSVGMAAADAPTPSLSLVDNSVTTLTGTEGQSRPSSLGAERELADASWVTKAFLHQR